MNDIRTAFLAALADIAPEVDEGDLDPTADLLDEYDLDSMDLLNLVTTLEEQLDMQIPESDYAQLRTLGGAVAYLGSSRAAPA